MRRRVLTIGSLAALLALAGCTSATESGPTGTASGTGTQLNQGQGVSSNAASDPATTATGATVSPAEKVLVRFTSGETAVDVSIAADNPTARDFLSLLPLTIPVEEFAGKEKLGALPRDLVTEGSPGSDPEDGDLIYFIPWGNLGFYYNAAGIGYSDQTIHLGTYNATAAQLAQLEGGAITVDIVR